ncbi:MAG: HAMP domain-containing histidine kinase [Planctomycetes bacterium]|nr:HAMP domain-containing histidine kinase [Planctomycetota bacterium]
MVWAVFAFGVAVAAGVMVWASLLLADLEHSHAEANQRALSEQSVRNALWQLESELTPIITDEAARPYFHYSAFYPAEGAYTRMFGEVQPDEPLLPSPLLRLEGGAVQVHFQYEPSGELTSPQAPEGEKQRLALRKLLSPEDIRAAQARLAHVRERVTREAMLAQLPSRKADPRQSIAADMVYADDSWASRNTQNQAEYQKRSEANKKAASKRKEEEQNDAKQQIGYGGDGPPPVDIREGPMSALWMGETLVLARRISLDGSEYVQGCVLDWEVIRGTLNSASRDLMPNATFRPAPLGATGVESASVQRLAALPIEVLPGEMPIAAPQAGISPLRVTLYVAWGCLVFVALSLAFTLRRTLALSARREEFVSAVTHELRTPLTTFRMYTEMLQSGRVPNEAARNEYYNTLHNEALRLGHLVENVLAYAKLERGRKEDRIEEVALSRLLERSTERMSQRAHQAGMQLDIAACPQAAVLADPGAVEQIMFNLVDNACKYATGGERRIEITCSVGNRARISVRDHGPGISKSEAAKLFQPFRKSAQQAANSAPGVGLGLALSRRLARAMGGDLSLDTGVQDGCCFVLTLPLA